MANLTLIIQNYNLDSRQEGVFTEAFEAYRKGTKGRDRAEYYLDQIGMSTADFTRAIYQNEDLTQTSKEELFKKYENSYREIDLYNLAIDYDQSGLSPAKVDETLQDLGKSPADLLRVLGREKWYSQDEKRYPDLSDEELTNIYINRLDTEILKHIARRYNSIYESRPLNGDMPSRDQTVLITADLAAANKKIADLVRFTLNDPDLPDEDALPVYQAHLAEQDYMYMQNQYRQLTQPRFMIFPAYVKPADKIAYVEKQIVKFEKQLAKLDKTPVDLVRTFSSDSDLSVNDALIKYDQSFGIYAPSQAKPDRYDQYRRDHKAADEFGDNKHVASVEPTPPIQGRKYTP